MCRLLVGIEGLVFFFFFFPLNCFGGVLVVEEGEFNKVYIGHLGSGGGGGEVVVMIESGEANLAWT